MTMYPSPGWRRTVGPQWSSVKQGSASGLPPGMQQGLHSSYLNAISRPDLNMDFKQGPQEQHHRQEPSSSPSGSAVSAANHPCDRAHHDHADTMSEHQRALVQQHQENQRQQEIYIQQLQVMQQQAMHGSTSRPWYPTFGPILPPSSSDSTIQLDHSNQYTLNNNTKLNRQAVGPHWRSIHTPASYSPTPSPPSSSPQMQPLIITPSSFSSLSTTSTTNTLHAYLSTTFSSPASIDQVRASSFQQDQDMEATSENPPHQPALHQQYYQKHSYPHDPRHHLIQGLAENSREARENQPLVSRGPVPPVSIKIMPTTPSAKRKAAWQEDDGEAEDNDEGSRSPQDELNQQYYAASYPTPTSSSSHGQLPFGIYSHTQQCIPATPQTPIDHDYDQEMGSSEQTCPNTQAVPQSSNRASIDTLDMDQEDMDTVEGAACSSRPASNSKRTKPRLDQSAIGIAEVRRRQSGEQVQDIFQECFYNAAASSR